MAGTPRYKVFDGNGEYAAAVKHLVDGAVLVAAHGEGWTVRNGHAKRDTLWTEGAEWFSAGDSYDAAAEVMDLRAQQNGLQRMGERLLKLGDAEGSTEAVRKLKRIGVQIHELMNQHKRKEV